MLKTAVDAFELGMTPYVIADASASHAGPRAHEAGLYLLGRIADRWGVNGRPSTCVWFEMDLSPPPDPTDDPTDDPTGGRDIENP